MEFRKKYRNAVLWRHGDMDMGIWIHGHMGIWRHIIKISGNSEVLRKKSNGKRKTEALPVFLNAFTVCSSCKRTFVLCPFVDEETSGSYPFSNGQNGLAHLIL
jgi:hypothetical protein